MGDARRVCERMPEARFTVSQIFRVPGTRIFPDNFPGLLPHGVVIFVRPYEFLTM